MKFSACGSLFVCSAGRITACSCHAVVLFANEKLSRIHVYSVKNLTKNAIYSVVNNKRSTIRGNGALYSAFGCKINKNT